MYQKYLYKYFTKTQNYIQLHINISKKLQQTYIFQVRSTIFTTENCCQIIK